MGKGGESGSGPSQSPVPPGLRGLRAAAAVEASGREASAQHRLRMPQGVPPDARNQWAEAFIVVGHKVLDACANARGADARADVRQALQEFGTLVQPQPPVGGQGNPYSGWIAPGGRSGGGTT